MDFWLILLTIIAGTIGIYLFSTWNFNYFKKLGIPHLKPSPIFGNMTEMFFKTKALPIIFQEAYNLNPEAKYVGFYDFSNPMIVLKDPELVESVMIKNFDCFTDRNFFAQSNNEPLFKKNLLALKGDEWREMRVLLSPAFTASKMKSMFSILSQCAIDFSTSLAELNPQPEALDMKETLGRYTVDVIASVAFGLSVNSMKDRDNSFYRMAKEAANFSGKQMLKFFVIKNFSWLGKLLNVTLIDPKTAAYFTDVIEGTIATRDAQGIVRPDMIQLMMQARDRKEKSALSSEDRAAQAFVFLLGGYLSSRTAMSFAIYYLGLNTDVQRKLQAEIDQVMAKNPGEVTYEEIQGMKYLDAVISETLRINPVDGFTDRIATKSFTLPPALPGLKPLHVKPGQSIFVPIYSFHRDAKYFPEPEKFDPERFSEDNKSKISPRTYFPFSRGPRACIASRFAQIEVKLALFHILARCNILPSSKTQFPFKLSVDSFEMVPEGGFWLKVEPRKYK